MSPVKEFGRSAEGQVAQSAGVSDIVVAGRHADVLNAMTLATLIGKAAQEGVANPVNMVARIDFDNVTRVSPGGGLQAKPGENYDADYKYKGESMFGLEEGMSGAKPH